MSVRRLTTFLAGAVIAASAAVFGVSSSAVAATSTEFSVDVRHANGSGALVSTISGKVNWFNWSVTLTDITQTVRSGECSYLWIDAYSVGNRHLFSKSTLPRCSGTFNPSYVKLDPEANGWPNTAIAKLDVYVVDSTHGTPEAFGEGQGLTRS